MKILFLQEYVREAHIKEENGQYNNIFFQTKGGQMLRKLVETGLGLQKQDYTIDYAYGLVPKVLQRDKYQRAVKYKPPTQKEAKEEYAYLYDRIVAEKPDIIIPTGNISCKALLGKSAISQLRGVPEKVTIKSTKLPQTDQVADEMQLVNLQKRLEMVEGELASFMNAYGAQLADSESKRNEKAALERKVEHTIHEIKKANGADPNTHECWVLPMYSMEYMLMNPNVQNLIEADFVTLQKFVEIGDKAFEASAVEYEFVTTMERVREIFTKDIPAAPIVSWDLETNTLRPESKGAKPLVISISYKEGTGVTIPLEHKDFQWLPGHLAELYQYIKDFVADPEKIKVGHNIQYDIRFLRLSRNFTKFANNRDTKVMYYLLVNQDVESTLRLSDLAYELTDMGGYDKALDVYKKKYIADHIAKDKARIEGLKDDYKRAVAAEKELAKEEGRKPIKMEKPDFPSAEPPKNEVDGGDFNYEWIPLESMLHPYASGDVDACLRIHNKLDQVGSKPENARLRKLYTEHYTDLTASLALIEANGIKMNVEYNKSLIEAYTNEEERLLQEMRKIREVQQLEEEYRALYQRGLEEWMKPKAERNEDIAKLRDKYKTKTAFNPNSSDDKKKVLFQYTGHTLPFNKEFLVDSATENGLSEDEIEWYHYKTDTKAALPYISDNYEHSKELADLLLTHSLVKTRKQNFTYKLLSMIDEEQRIHGGFNPTGTATTRLSSSNPNLQQLPRKTGDVRRFDYQHPIKRMFVTSFEGGALLQLDYSSLESRVLALAAQDDEMTQAFLDGADIHKETASLVFGIPIEEVTDDERSAAKSTTFGIAYGETPFSYYSKHGMTLEQAEKLFEDFFRNKPKIKKFIDVTHAQVKKEGFVECLHGFRRNLRDVYSQDKSKANGALRQSVNTKIQGSGAYLTNTSVIYINKYIESKNMRSKVVLTVHDSIVLDCPPEEVHIMAKVAKHIMENLPIDWLFIDWKGGKLRYPIAADVEIGVTYNDMVNYDMEELNTFSSIHSYCKYNLDMKKLKDFKQSGVIDEDRYDAMKAQVEGQKPVYQSAS